LKKGADECRRDGKALRSRRERGPEADGSHNNHTEKPAEAFFSKEQKTKT